MNWADHCSSDDESDDGRTHPARVSTSIDNDLSYDDSAKEKLEEDENLEVEEEVRPFPAALDFSNMPETIPSEAPFTGYIRNLAFRINTPEYLMDVVERLIDERYEGQQKVKPISARIGFDRETKKPMGFGYVEFNSAQELMIFLNLNDGHSKVMGRRVTIDIARPAKKRTGNYRSNRSHVGEIDGSQFKGGLVKKNQDGKSEEPRQRTSLKLAPRSTTGGVDSAQGEDGRSSIFGNAKPANDIAHWQSSREKLPRSDGEKRGGRNKAGGEKKQSKGKRDKISKEGEENADGFKTAPAASVSKAPAVQVSDKKATVKVQNAFSALGFDSDSE